MKTRLLLGLCLVALFAVFIPVDGQVEAIGPKIDPELREYLIQLKADQWTRMVEIDRLVRNQDRINPAELPSLMVLEQKLSEGLTPFDFRYDRRVDVSSSEELTAALANAEPGDFIYLQDGVYNGNFEITVDGTNRRPITLYGERGAIIEGESLETDYGLHLMADYWVISGFSIRHFAKGIMADGANHNIIQSVEIYDIGDEGLHLRSFSSDNIVRYNWIRDTGIVQPAFGEGIYIGSAVDNWGEYTNGEPDASDNNQIIGNLIGPRVPAEGIDIKEGTTGGLVSNNTFIGTNEMVVDSWIDIKGNEYHVENNSGSYNAESGLETDVEVFELEEGWGLNNVIENNEFVEVTAVENEWNAPFVVRDRTSSYLNLVVPGRALPYRLSELIARYPTIFEPAGEDTFLLKAHLNAVSDATLYITHRDVHRLLMMSTDDAMSSVTGHRSIINIEGLPGKRVEFVGWDPIENAERIRIDNGRPWVEVRGGRMDINHAGFYYLGFEEGTTSGASWKGFQSNAVIEFSEGSSFNSEYAYNYFGAYSYEAVNMVWRHNVWRNNLSYGFDPHDFSNDFIVEENEAYDNGKHGIIFSRGCDRNVIRNNLSYNNAGHGIMIDDGKVIDLTRIPRYQFPVPSNNNILEGNHMWNNLDGIVLEGGVGNIVRNNVIEGKHRYGIRLKDDVRESDIHDNVIKSADRYAMFIYNESSDNRIHDNNIRSMQSGFGLQDAHNNIIANNDVHVIGAAVRLKQTVNNNLVQDNHFSGRGSWIIDDRTSLTSTATEYLHLNHTADWREPPPVYTSYVGIAALVIWLSLMGMPFVMRIVMYIKQPFTGQAAKRHLGMNS